INPRRVRNGRGMVMANSDWRIANSKEPGPALLLAIRYSPFADEDRSRLPRGVCMGFGRACPRGLPHGRLSSIKGRPAMLTATATKSDLETLTALNADYIRSVQTSDVTRFDQILAEDFVCTNPDGSFVDRAAFLKQTARPVAISDLAAHDVMVRVIGDCAVINARTSYRLADGRAGAGRYTDVWARRNGQWLAIAAHVTRGSGN